MMGGRGREVQSSFFLSDGLVLYASALFYGCLQFIRTLFALSDYCKKTANKLQTNCKFFTKLQANCKQTAKE